MNFDEIIDRKPTDSLKWLIYGEDVLPLWVADMDFRCPQPVMDALKTRVDHGISVPPACNGCPENQGRSWYLRV